MPGWSGLATTEFRISCRPLFFLRHSWNFPPNARFVTSRLSLLASSSLVGACGPLEVRDHTDKPYNHMKSISYINAIATLSILSTGLWAAESPTASSTDGIQPNILDDYIYGYAP